ncbi:hypothetical protein PMAYCL1PPCAC_32249, partial [Pristionchus mayeri]
STMGDFDMSKDYRLAGAILFPMALVGLACNVSVVRFIKSIPSLNNSFGSVTLSQAVVDSIHQFFMAFYFAPTIFFRNKTMYALSAQFGYAILSAYQICCYSHLFISLNRFFAVCAPLAYRRLFRWGFTFKKPLAVVKMNRSCFTVQTVFKTYVLARTASRIYESLILH